MVVVAMVMMRMRMGMEIVVLILIERQGVLLRQNILDRKIHDQRAADDVSVSVKSKAGSQITSNVGHVSPRP